jgi:hypothetical protein
VCSCTWCHIWKEQIFSPRLTAALFWPFGNVCCCCSDLNMRLECWFFSLCVLSNWPFLQQSVWVNVQRMKCVIQTEGNKIRAGSYLSCRHLVVSTPISSGWVFLKLSECWETSVKDVTVHWNKQISVTLEIFAEKSPQGPTRLTPWT